MNLSTQKSLRQGFSLLELVVVLVILIALGSMIVAIIPGLMGRAHFAKCSTTIPELNRIWQREFVLNQRYPDRLDSMLATGGAALFSALPGTDAGGEVVLGTLTTDEIAALNAIGLRNVYHLATTPGDVTFGASPYGALSTPFDNSQSTMSVALLQPLGKSVISLNLKRHLGRDGVPGGTDQNADDPNVKYLVLGIGPNCTIVGPGRGMEEAPVHFGGEDGMNPQQNYQRYCVIYSVNGTQPAKFETACSIHPTGLDGAEAHIRSYYNATQEN